jgi:NAD(P)-dependent dehydrogenase (short-subunit alcohol dehydrogenase family)
MTGMLEGKTALITGAASGIGASTARLFAREGARLFLTDWNAEAGAALATELSGQGYEAWFKPADVSNETEVEALLNAVQEKFGHLDCAFNNAGINSRGMPIDEFDLVEWNRVLAINLTGVFLCMKYELKLMKPRGSGSIVNTSSGGGLIAVPNLSAYCAAKHGVLGLTKTAAREVVTHGIRVNAVLPGSTETPMIQESIGGNENVRAMILASTPSGRMGRPEEIAEAVLWLCSDRSSYVSGDSVLVDMASVAR